MVKLSEAIRLGAMLKPQGFYFYEHAGATCAMGAALDAVGRLMDTFPSELWPVAGAVVSHPVTGEMYVLGAHVTELNDEHRWTREQIADWVETIERKHEAKVIETPAPATVAVDGV